MLNNQKAEYQDVIVTWSRRIAEFGFEEDVELTEVLWDPGSHEMNLHTHKIRLATRYASEIISIPHASLTKKNDTTIHAVKKIIRNAIAMLKSKAPARP